MWEYYSRDNNRVIFVLSVARPPVEQKFAEQNFLSANFFFVDGPPPLPPVTILDFDRQVFYLDSEASWSDIPKPGILNHPTPESRNPDPTRSGRSGPGVSRARLPGWSTKFKDTKVSMTLVNRDELQFIIT